MSRQLNVALLAPCFWPEVRRGGERFVHELGVGLADRGHKPRLITSHPARKVTMSTEDGFEILRLPRPPGGGRLERRNMEDHLLHVPLTYAALRTQDYDVAHAMHPSDAIAAGRYTKATGKPSILSFLGLPDHQGLMYRRRRLQIMETALKECAAVTSLSETVAAEFKRTLGYDSRVIYPGVDLKTFVPGPKADEPVIFCSAAVGEARKRVDLLVRAFVHVRRERPTATLALSDPGDEGVRRNVAGDVEGVRWVNVDDRDDLARMNAHAWVAVLPSFGEAFGLVLVEALACGTPVVGANRGAIPEIVDRPEVGALFEGEDERAVAAALLGALELAGDPSTPENCRTRAMDFSTDRTTEEYLQLYRDVGV